MTSVTRKTRSVRSVTCRLALLLYVTFPAASQEKTIAAPDTLSFVEAEQNVRHEFLQRYPLLDQVDTTLGSQPGKNRPAMEFLKRLNQLPDDQKFVPDFAYVMQGKVEIKKKTAAPPSYWQHALAGLMATLPHGDALGKSYLGMSEAKAARENRDAPNRLAVDNMQNFRELVEGYGVASGGDFDHASPLRRTRYILLMFAKVQEDLRLPCPFTVYLLDIDRSTSDDDTGTPSVPKEIVGRLLGTNSPEYLHFPENSREQKSLALRHAYLHLLDDANRVAISPLPEALRQYLRFAGLELSASGTDWYVEDEFHKSYTFTDLMRSTFGDAELEKFNHEPEGSEKEADRVAVILLWTQYRMGCSGWMMG